MQTPFLLYTIYMNSLKSFFAHSHFSSLLTVFGSIVVFFDWFLFLLTLFQSFLPSLVFLGAFISLIPLLFVGRKIWGGTSSEIRLVIIFSLFFTLLIGIYTVPTIFSGRDQGSISEAAFRLAQNGKLIFSTPASHTFFALHEKGPAQNFPGFAYTKTGDLITQFPLGYTSWLAGFVILFGEHGFIISNTLLLFLSLLFFYALLRKFVHPLYASAGLLLFATSFILIWFAKMTLSENLALFLFLSLCFALISFFEEGKILFYVSALLSASLLAFTRIEGFVILGITIAILTCSPYTNIIRKKYLWRSILLPLLFFLCVFIIDVIVNLPYYTVIGKALFKFLHITKSETLSTPITSLSPSLWSHFFLYGLGIVFILGLTAILFFIKEKRWLLLMPTLLTLPTFIYLIDPNISPDHPWMLRRFLFSIFPTLLFSAIVGIARLFSFQKSIPFSTPKGKPFFAVTFLFLILLLSIYPAFIFGFSFAENRGLKEQALSVSQLFLDTDLVLVERGVTGSGFSMMTGTTSYLTEKNIVYFFNPNDLFSLNTTPYTHVYLIVPEKDQLRYTTILDRHLSFQKTILFSTNQLENTPSAESNIFPSFPKKVIKETRNSLFIFH